MVLKQNDDKSGVYKEVDFEQVESQKNAEQEFDTGNDSWDLGFQILKLLITLYTYITLPVYFLTQRPWKVWKEKRIVWAKPIRKDDPYSPIGRTMINHDKSLEGISTMDEAFQMTVSKYGNRKCMGFRTVLDEIEEKDKSGKVFIKLRLGNYQWFSYNYIAKSVDTLSKGFLALGLQPKQLVAIFAETRREWFLILQACFRNNITVATLYATLGADGIIHTINETEVSTIFISQGLFSKLQKISDKIPTINKIIYMENVKPADTSGFPSSMSIIKLSDIERMGHNYECAVSIQPARSDDIALIMYTNGSTGRPKGVMISHRNMISFLAGAKDMAIESNKYDVGISFLPLAHIYGLMMEYTYLVSGVKYGYASPYTLLDTSTGLADECKGDATLLKPTIFSVVPLLLNRLVKGINAKLSAESTFTIKLFKYAVQYKAFWEDKGFRSPILNRIVFSKIQQILGGNVRYFVSGSCHLPTDTQLFVRTCFNAVIRQCYGMTESTACGTAMTRNDYSIGRSGAPYRSCIIKLVDWDEGGYKATDKPHPRGELVLGGPCITLGYYKNAELTKEAYKEEDGERWMYSGDIGELFPDGTFKLIDRKKSLHKLQRGEYVSLSKVEEELKVCPLVDNICVVGSKNHDYLVALVQPNEPQLRKLVSILDKDSSTFSDLCQDKQILEHVTNKLKTLGKKSCLLNWEIPQKFKLCSEEWLPETGMVTSALKVNRKTVEEFYKTAIDDMYIASVNSP